ncbi:MAG TPA: amidohydrolase family protein [Acidimicrobiales bacterium]|nr:amidohydrolase family protein [Acidimicrobiales bacterium]
MERMVLRRARVVDGTGGPSRSVDVEVVDGRIATVGEVPPAAGEAVEVDLAGLVLAPGFVDIHTHFDAQVLWDPDLTPSSWHGVTTVVLGNCGFGVAPARPVDRPVVIETLEHVEGMNATALEAGIDWTFESYPEYLDVLDARPKRLNVAAMVPHSMVRLFVMGADAATSRPATDDEVAEMCAVVRDGLAAGALGLSSSQAPTHVGAFGRPVPSRLAGVDELRRLLGTVAAAGRGIAEVTYGPLMEIAAAAGLSRELGVRMTWGSLLTGLFGGHGAAMALLEQASAVGADFWPQVSCREIVFQMSLGNPYYFNQVPAFSEVIGRDPDEQRQRYADSDWRSRVKPDVLAARPGAYDRISVEETEIHGDLRGRTMAALAAERGAHPFDVMMDLALEEDLATRFRIVSRNDDADELGELVRDQRTLLGAHDAGAHVDMVCDAGFPSHLLGHWVRDLGALDLERAVWRLSGQPAEVFGVPDRGRIEPGYWADLVAFDPDRVAAQPNERRYDFPGGTDRLVCESRGVEHVWVAGTAVRRDGHEVPGAAPGVLVRA